MVNTGVLYRLLINRNFFHHYRNIARKGDIMLIISLAGADDRERLLGREAGWKSRNLAMFILILAFPAPCSNITDTRRAVCLIQVKCDISLCLYCHITRQYVNSINTALLIFWSFAWCIRDRFSPSFSVILLENNWYLFLAWLGQVLRNWTRQARYQYTLHWIERFHSRVFRIDW